MHFGIGPQPNTGDQSASLAYLPARSCPERTCALTPKSGHCSATPNYPVYAKSRLKFTQPILLELVDAVHRACGVGKPPSMQAERAK